MIFLQLLVPQREILVVEKVMSQVVANVSEYTAAVHRCRKVPIEGEKEMRKLPERRGKSDKKSRGHDESVLVHGEIVVNAVQEEVQRDPDSVVRKPSRQMLDCEAGNR